MESRQRPAILLLPGMDGTGVLFRALRRAMEPTVDVHVVEYPTDGPCDYRAALQHAQDRLAALPACHIVGWSFSGPIALCLARSQPDRVRSVTLVATFVQSPLASLRLVAPLMFSPLVGIARAVRRLPVWLGRAADDPVRRDKAELWRRVGARTLAARARAIRRVDARADLAAVTQAIQYLAPRDDRIVPPRNLAQIRSIREDVEVVHLDGDHFALYADPEASAAAILSFVARAEAKAAT